MSNCPHIRVVNCGGWIERERESFVKVLLEAAEGPCYDCSKGKNGSKPSSEAVYLCLSKNCGMLGCSRNERSHAAKHYKNNKTPQQHCLSINVRSLQVWCYECDEFVENWEELLEDLRNRLEQILTTKNEKNEIEEGSISFYENFGAVGLYNTGNSCFINAALQILLNCPTLMQFFGAQCREFIGLDLSGSGSLSVSVMGQRSTQQPSISEQFLGLVEAVSGPNRPKAVSPAKLIRTASHFNPAFHGYSQQDSMDFFRLLLDRLHEELKYPVPAGVILEAEKGNHKKTRRKSGRLASNSGDLPGGGVVFRSVISETFGGIMRSEVQCHKCNKVSVKDDQFFDLSLPLQPSPTASTSPSSSKNVMTSLFNSLSESLGLTNGKGLKLESAFVNFCLPEVLEGKDRYFCENCRQLVVSTKTLTLKSLPQILCVQLKRFRHDSYAYFSSKVNFPVEYPLEGLDLRHFLHKEFIGSPLSSNSEYDLLGIVSHRGSFNGGHYVAYCRNFDCKSGKWKWFEFDDSRVNEISESELKNNIQAYLLFYIQKSDLDLDRKNQRQEIINKITSLKDTNKNDECKHYVSRQWWNRLLNSNNPGPIDSYDVTCTHGNLKPSLFTKNKDLNLNSFLQPLPECEELFERMRTIYGELGEFGILNDPMECEKCLEELKKMSRRRAREAEEVQKLDSTTIGTGDVWYLIDSNWLHRWTCFKSGQQPPPGPISNHHLLKPPTKSPIDPLIPRDNLTRGIHYRGVNESVWEYFYKIYGGGPVLKRSSINIYST